MRMPRIPPNVALVTAAIALGVLAFWGAAGYLASQARQAEERLAGQYAPQAIVVAAADLPSGTAVDSAPIASRRVPAAYVSSDAVPAAQVQQLAGRRLRVPLRRGDPVTWSVLDDESRPSLAGELGEGLRALTVPVDEAASFAGLLEPGDLVDLLYASDQGGRDAGPVVRPLLQAVRVLATGRETRRTRSRDAAGNERVIESPFSTVTVLASPRDAQRILVAQRSGSLHVLLRAPGDAAPAALGALSAAVLRAAGTTSRRSAAARMEVLVAGPGPLARRSEAAGD